MEPTFSPAWFATFGRPDDAVTAREVELLELVLPAPPATVLDVPCGFGRHAQALAALGYVVTGVEREPAVAAAARTAVEGDRLLTSLDYPDGTRDEFEWRLYEPQELAELGRVAGLRLERADGNGTPRQLLVFGRL